MAYGVDSEINERVDMYASDPQKLAQRYAQSQSLLDLLALQKLKSDKEAAARNLQAQMQAPMNTVKDQREQQVLDMTRNEVAQQAQQGGQQLALNQQRAMQARGIPTQAAPNMRGMMGGGIVGYQAGGEVGERGLLEKIGRTFLGDESYDILRQQSESNKANTQMQPPMTESERVTYLQNLMLKRKAAGATDAEIQRIQEEIDSYDLGGIKSSGLKGFQEGGIVGYKTGDLVEGEDEPFIDLGALFGLIGKGRDYLFSPSRATQEARAIRQGEVEQASDRGANLLNVLPPSQGLTAEQLASFDKFDVTGSLPPQLVEERRERVESGEAARMLEQQAARRAEANAARKEDKPSVPQNAGITADMYDVRNMMAKKDPTNAQKLGSMVGKESAVLRDNLDEREPEGGMDTRALRAFLQGMGETGIGGGSAALRTFEDAERARADELETAEADRKMRKELLREEYGFRDNELRSKLLSESLASEREADRALLENIMTTIDMDPEFQLAAEQFKDTYDVFFGSYDKDKYAKALATKRQELIEQRFKDAKAGMASVLGGSSMSSAMGDLAKYDI